MHLGAKVIRLLWRRSTHAPAPTAAAHPDPFGPGFERKLEILARLGRRTQRGLFRVERRDKRRGSGVEFADYRDYVPGDDFRFVDPYAAMRLDKLYLRQFEEQEDQSVYLLIDASLSMGEGARKKLDCAKRLAAAIAFIGLSKLDRVTVVALAEHVNLQHPTTRGRGQFLSILRFLRELEPTGATCLETALRRFTSQYRRRGPAVLLSDLFDPAGCERGLDVLRYERFEPTILHIRDGRELEPELTGDVTVVDCETGRQCDVTVTRTLEARLRAAHAEFSANVDHHCRAHGIGYFQLEAETPFDVTIQRLLGEKGRPLS